MGAVKEISWEEAMAPDFGTPARTAWREAVADIAAKAHDKLPEWPYGRECATRRHKRISEFRPFPCSHSALARPSKNPLEDHTQDLKNAEKRPDPGQVGNCCHALVNL